MEYRETVIAKYESGMPIKEIASELSISEVKVRRILITEELWSSRASEEVMILYKRGLSAAEIAKKLGKPLKTVQAYMPYTYGEYGTDEVLKGGLESRKYRKRNRAIANRHNSRRKEKAMNIVNLDEYRTTKKFERENRRVMRLHMELVTDIEDKEEAVLKKYGKCQHGITRDILVPSDMPLHNLSYVIQRAFGWQNSHLHRFSYPKEVFDEITTGFLDDWLSLCGVYYRFPQDEFDDLYWDDDYDGVESFSRWLRKKYTGPYCYKGEVEHYMYAQKQAQMFRQENPIMRVGATFEEFLAGKTENKIKKLEEVEVSELLGYFESGMDELLERLPIEQVLGMSVSNDCLEKADEIVDELDDAFADLYHKEQEIVREIKPEYVGEKLWKFYQETNPVVIPLSDTLGYFYDYGDGWEVEITCTGVYVADEETSWGDLSEDIERVFSEYRPVCVAADGLPVMDDVGGIGGYCAFLLGFHGQDCGPYDFADKEETREWGKMMGWNGRMKKPGNIL